MRAAQLIHPTQTVCRYLINKALGFVAHGVSVSAREAPRFSAAHSQMNWRNGRRVCDSQRRMPGAKVRTGEGNGHDDACNEEDECLDMTQV